MNISGPPVGFESTDCLVHESGLLLGLGCSFLIVFLLQISVLLFHMVLAELRSVVHFGRTNVDKSVKIVFLKEAVCDISVCYAS